MRIEVFTIFPQLITNFASESLMGRAQRSGILSLQAHDLREMATDVHRSVDDSPYGGGPGMVLSPEPVFSLVEAVRPPRPIYLLSPGGRVLNQNYARELAKRDGFSLLCGRYEGVDQRIVDHLCDGEISIGNFVLAGGEAAALVVIEAVTRLIPGVMGNTESAKSESFSRGLLEHPQYTRPAKFRQWQVPEVLQSGDHQAIAEWRRAWALARTLRRRPDLIAARGGLSEEEKHLVEKYA